MNTTHSRRCLAALAVAAFLVAGAGRASAQEIQGLARAAEPAGTDAAQQPEGWGTSTLSVHTVNSFAFESFDSTTVYGGDGSNGRVVNSGGLCWEAPVVVPTGSIIDHTELEACDTNASADVSSVLFICNLGVCSTGYNVSTTGSGGCAKRASAVPASPTVVQNGASTYTMQVCNGAVGATQSFKAARVFYRLQVSAAPATATFPNDVPTTHPFFRFVEAMAASGLTGGCGAGSFCPDSPVTRGQMAVFLSNALGLHFPN